MILLKLLLLVVMGGGAVAIVRELMQAAQGKSAVQAQVTPPEEPTA